jgi:hypothetical protein
MMNNMTKVGLSLTMFDTIFMGISVNRRYVDNAKFEAVYLLNRSPNGFDPVEENEEHYEINNFVNRAPS